MKGTINPINSLVGFKNYKSAQNALLGIEVMAMQRKTTMGDDNSPVELFYALAAEL